MAVSTLDLLDDGFQVPNELVELGTGVLGDIGIVDLFFEDGDGRVDAKVEIVALLHQVVLDGTLGLGPDISGYRVFFADGGSNLLCDMFELGLVVHGLTNWEKWPTNQPFILRLVEIQREQAYPQLPVLPCQSRDQNLEQSQNQS